MDTPPNKPCGTKRNVVSHSWYDKPITEEAALEQLGIAADRIYTDHGLTGTNRSRPGLDQALAAVRRGDTLVVPKLDRLARSVPDARFIADALVARHPARARVERL